MDLEERLARCRADTCESIRAGIGVLLDREDKHARLRESINKLLDRIAAGDPHEQSEFEKRIWGAIREHFRKEIEKENAAPR